MVIDEDSRTIVLEGLGKSNGGLTMLLRKVGRTGPNGQGYRALESTRQRFSQRLYTCFSADLKKVLVTVISIVAGKSLGITDTSKRGTRPSRSDTLLSWFASMTLSPLLVVLCGRFACVILCPCYARIQTFIIVRRLARTVSKLFRACGC